jgi:hypothetical protein
MRYGIALCLHIKTRTEKFYSLVNSFYLVRYSACSCLSSLNTMTRGHFGGTRFLQHGFEFTKNFQLENPTHPVVRISLSFQTCISKSLGITVNPRFSLTRSHLTTKERCESSSGVRKWFNDDCDQVELLIGFFYFARTWRSQEYRRYLVLDIKDSKVRCQRWIKVKYVICDNIRDTEGVRYCYLALEFLNQRLKRLFI